MWQGMVQSIHISQEKSQPMASSDTVVCVPGYGIEGDRYALGKGTHSHKPLIPEEARQITLIESETLEALRRDWNIDLSPSKTRRNIVTTDVPLNHLVGRKFGIGEKVIVEGMVLNVPCQYLEDLLAIKSLFKALINRSGLNCRILEGGKISLRDIIRPLEN